MDQIAGSVSRNGAGYSCTIEDVSCLAVRSAGTGGGANSAFSRSTTDICGAPNTSVRVPGATVCVTGVTLVFPTETSTRAVLLPALRTTNRNHETGLWYVSPIALASRVVFCG